MSKFKYNEHKYTRTEMPKEKDLVINKDGVALRFIKKNEENILCEDIFAKQLIKIKSEEIWKFLSAEIPFDKNFEEKNLDLNTTDELNIFDIIVDRKGKQWVINDINKNELELVRFPILQKENGVIVVKINLKDHKYLIKNIYGEVQNER